MQGQKLIIISIVIVVIVVVVATLQLLKKKKLKKCKDSVHDLERDVNLIASTPVLLELSKVETVINNAKMEEKYNKWLEKFNNIKEKDLSSINDMIIDLASISRTPTSWSLTSTTRSWAARSSASSPASTTGSRR